MALVLPLDLWPTQRCRAAAEANTERILKAAAECSCADAAEELAREPAFAAA
jgi:hypothetical protein